ncbi:MAG: Bax inhibitor-1/YccA family protein [Kiritimatiellae bacterium]|jgi:uncharacterized YccA/Bax inhibitor family protein|nr:Bax inhibitor-1/YccA family protein [Kiritimatiellia bacterium]
MYRSGNPVLKSDRFSAAEGAGQMTINGTINKTGFLLLLAMVSASYVWSVALNNVNAAQGWMMAGLVGGFICAMVCAFSPKSTPFMSPVYALLEGLFLGGISAMYNKMYPGIVIQAVLGTFGVMLAMLFIYRAGIIKVNNKFIMGVAAATGGIFLIYLFGFILSLFGVPISLFGNGIMGIGFSVLVVGIASLNLVVDFFFIEQMSNRNAPKYMEWYGAFSLMITLVWLYISILRLLGKLNRN